MAYKENVSSASWLKGKLKFPPCQIQLTPFGLGDSSAIIFMSDLTVLCIYSIQQLNSLPDDF